METRFEKYFLTKANLDRWHIESDSTEGIERVIVIPALAESQHLFKALADLESQPAGLLSTTLIVVVVNNRPAEQGSPEIFLDNRSTLDKLRNLDRSKLRIGVVDASSPGRELGTRDGVGAARKIGLDLAAHLLLSTGREESPLVSLDADCRTPSNYLGEIDRFFAVGERWAAVIEYGHPLDDDPAVENLRGILGYESHLRSHELGLRLAGSPYAYPTIGSTIASTAKAYVTCGGMRKRTAAEDFYFLQELRKTGKVEFITRTRVTPSARVSDRVPFGTGRSMGEYRKSSEKGLLSYHPDGFVVLGNWLTLMEEDLDREPTAILSEVKKFSPPLAAFLLDRDFPGAWDRIRGQARTRDRRVREFHRWFDAFKTLKAIHHLRDETFGLAPVFTTIGLLLNKMGVDSPIRFDRISASDTARQIEALQFLREAMKEMKE